MEGESKKKILCQKIESKYRERQREREYNGKVGGKVERN